MSQKPIKLQSDLFRPGDESDIMAIGRLEYGETDINAQLIHWFSYENPVEPVTICVVRDSDSHRVVGSVRIIPLRMFIFGQNCIAARVTGLVIHPDYRNSLAYVKLMRRRNQVLRQKGFPLRFSFMVEEYFERVIRVEPISSFCVPLLVRPLDMIQLARTRFTQRWLQLTVGWSGQVVAPWWFRRQGKVTQQDRLVVSWIDQFDERFDDFWECVQGKYAVMAVRDRAYLSWRFAPASGRTYRTLIATVSDKIVGYLVLRSPDPVQGIPTGLIMDLLFEVGIRGMAAGQLLLEKAWQHFQKQDVWLAAGLALPHTAEYQAMQLAGYRPCPRKLAPRVFRLVFQSYSETVPDTTCIKADDWFITSADYPAH